MSNPMVCSSFIFYIKIVGVFTKRVFPHFTTFGNNPLQLISMDLEFPIIPMLMSFFEIFYIVFLIIPFLDQSLPFHWRYFWFVLVNEIFTSCICEQHLSFLYLINRFWEGNRYFLKTTQLFIHKNFCSVFIINLECFDTTLNEVKW